MLKAGKVVLLYVLAGFVASQAQAAVDLRASLAGGTLEIDGGGDNIESDQVGADFRAKFDANEHVFIRGQYLTLSGDEVDVNGSTADVDIGMDVLRLGAGYGGNVGPIRVYGVAEYVKLTFDIEDESFNVDGFGITGGISDQGKSKLLWSAELSLLNIDSTTGASLDASIGYRFTPGFSGLVGVQSYAFEDDEDYETTAGQAYIGVQFSF